MKLKTNTSGNPTAIILIGPMGCGKTTIGKLLKEQTGWQFMDADDYHPQANIDKMAAGLALNDEDRHPWLLRLRAMIDKSIIRKTPIILACSALKQSYRETLGIDQQKIVSVYLKGDPDLLASRIGNRSHQYMNKGLLDSQLATMEEPDGGLTVDIGTTPESIVSEIITTIQARTSTVRK
ncbi:gluconokinase [Desulforhopalus sp. IMCC35007]|uniref:gluconokinase n=1 Tax=Desulforhopalus sp. IMCC35007 TaxID=2569543 RepID=UPI0010AE9893|nr:gluconokinase [Desulforhopalus sp. IMCC35007]TKB06824.1 gluconokinase [Desulforhopalus sp. IMCC35007]